MASEATLASELGIPYACLCAVDNFGNGIIERPLSYEQIVATQARNEDVVRSVITAALGALG